MGAGSGRSIYVIFPKSKNVQRLGSLAVVCKLASATRATGLQSISRSYRLAIASTITVPEEERATIIKFLGKRNLARKYQLTAPQLQIEAQDWLLAAPNLPSRTGSEKEDVAQTIDLAVQLGLLWPNSFQRTWAGNLLAEKTGDVIASFRQGDRKLNPYILTKQQLLILGFQLIEFDRTFLKFLVRILLGFAGAIDFSSLIAAIQEHFGSFVDELRDSASGPEDQRLLAELVSVRTQLVRQTIGRKAAPSGVTKQTVRRGYEELLYWRLETLVDLQYLLKPDPDSYSYLSTDSLRSLSKILEMDYCDCFFQHWWKCRGMNAVAASVERARELMFHANREKSNAMGYTLIREGAITANLLALAEGRDEVIEISTAIAAVQRGSDDRLKVLASVDRDRNLSAYKMVEM